MPNQTSVIVAFVFLPRLSSMYNQSSIGKMLLDIDRSMFLLIVYIIAVDEA